MRRELNEIIDNLYSEKDKIRLELFLFLNNMNCKELKEFLIINENIYIFSKFDSLYNELFLTFNNHIIYKSYFNNQIGVLKNILITENLNKDLGIKLDNLIEEIIDIILIPKLRKVDDYERFLDNLHDYNLNKF